MADLALQRRSNGKYDFVLAGADLATTSEPYPAILRLLIQDSWVGDDGERAPHRGIAEERPVAGAGGARGSRRSRRESAPRVPRSA